MKPIDQLNKAVLFCLISSQGESYGKFPSALIEGTPQWKKHTQKFDEAWHNKWEELMLLVQEKDEEESQKCQTNMDSLQNNRQITEPIDHLKKAVHICQEFPSEQESSEQQNFTQIKEELKKWLVEYLSIYRAKDQEQLVCVIMDDHYEELSELLIEAEESNNSEKAQKFSQNALSWGTKSLDKIGQPSTTQIIHGTYKLSQ